MDLVDRLHARLLEAARREHPDTPAPALTVAEVYQRLVPYRALRGELGITELAEYESALLRLLAGERGYLELELPRVRDELRRELAAPNPILGVYRDYAAVGVRLGPGSARVAAVPPPPAPPPPPAATPPRPRAEPDAACRGCGNALPDEPDVRFCPHCGREREPVPCAKCGAPLRAAWNFCIRCGTARPTAPPA